MKRFTRFLFMDLCVILAGGKGTRLRPLTYSKPKPLAPVGNKPIIDYAIELLADHGFSEIVVLVNYLGHALEDHLKRMEGAEGVEVRIVRTDSLDTADAVRKASSEIDRDFLVFMGDTLTNADVSRLVKYHEKSKGLVTAALRSCENPLAQGVVCVDREGRVTLSLERPLSYELYVASLVWSERIARGGLASAGMYAAKYEVLDILSDNYYLMDWSKHVLPFLLESGYEVYGWVMDDSYWLDVGGPSDYLCGNWDAILGELEPYGPRGECDRGVWRSGEVEVGEGAKIVPPVALGERVRIERGAVVGPYAVVGDECRIGEGATVCKSVLWNRVDIGESSSISDSVLADGVEIGAGALVSCGSLLGEEVVVEEGAIARGVKMRPGEVLKRDS